MVFISKKKDQPITFENAYASEIGERFAGQILKNLTVKSSISTDVINLSYTSVNADEARKILNTLIKVYIELDLKWGSEDAVQSVRFLENLIQKQEGELYNAEEKIRDFKKVNKIYDIQGNTGSFSSELLSIETEIYNISAEMNIRIEKRQILKSKLSNDEQSLADQLTNNINNQLLALREEISKLESNLFQNILSYGKNHSAVIELQLRIEALKSELDNKVSSLIDKGITVQDPLQSREDIITELLTLDSEILGLELKKFESQKIMKIFQTS